MQSNSRRHARRDLSTRLAALQMAALQTENDALKDRLQDLADLLDSHPDDYYLGLDAGSSNEDDEVEAAADADNLESDEAEEEYLRQLRQLEETHSSDENDDVEAAADADNVDADEADEAYLRQIEEAYE